MVRVLRGLGLSVVGLALVASSAVLEEAQGGASAGVIRVAQKQKTAKKKARAKAAAPAEATETPATPAASTAPAATEGDMKFSRDIAPILVANCAGCHIRPAKKRGDFDMTTFQKLMDGTKKEKVIAPGKPDESHLVLRIRGEETPKMPQGANNNLSDAAVAKIEQWVKAGAVLDAGKDANAPIESYASSPEDLRKAQLAKLTPEQRDRQVETVGLGRWKKASSKTAAEVTTGKHFLLFSTLPKTRAASALKRLDDQYEAARSLFGDAGVDWGEKGSLFIFNDSGSYGEFVQANEQRQVEAGDTGTARMSVPQPYVAVIDPLGGRDGHEPSGSAAARKPGRSKKVKAGSSADEANLGGPDRSLAGLLTENLIAGAAARTGKPPRWLTLGLGALVASRVEPGSAYYRKIRRDAFEVCQIGWTSKANEALGDQDKTEVVRAVGFAVLDWVVTMSPKSLPPFVAAMAGGGEKLDDAVGNVMNLSRPELLAGSGEFVMSRYGR